MCSSARVVAFHALSYVPSPDSRETLSTAPPELAKFTSVHFEVDLSQHVSSVSCKHRILRWCSLQRGTDLFISTPLGSGRRCSRKCSARAAKSPLCTYSAFWWAVACRTCAKLGLARVPPAGRTRRMRKACFQVFRRRAYSVQYASRIHDVEINAGFESRAQRKLPHELYRGGDTSGQECYVLEYSRVALCCFTAMYTMSTGTSHGRLSAMEHKGGVLYAFGLEPCALDCAGVDVEQLQGQGVSEERRKQVLLIDHWLSCTCCIQVCKRCTRMTWCGDESRL